MNTSTKTGVRRPPRTQRPTSPQKDQKIVRFIPLGGLEEVGRNMSVLEYGDEIIIVDMGLQFPEEDTPGIDYIIPNITSLIPKKKNVRAIVITHGHYDHIGAIPYLVGKLGPNIPIYTAALTKEIVKKRQGEFPNAPKLNIEVVKNGDRLRLSPNIEAEFFETEHTIPDSISIVFKTPVGNFAYFSDIKVDYDINGKPQRLDVFHDIAKHKIHTMFLESTRAEAPGNSMSERIVEKNLDELISKAKGRIIVGLFASLLTRASDILKIAEKHTKKVFLSGLSLKSNVNAAQNLGYIKVPKGLIVPLEELHKYHDDKILILATGAQGEPKASLMKIANGESKHITVKKGDTFIFSASVIPGNEKPVQTLKDNLTRQGARVIQTQHIDVHASGHGPSGDLKMIIDIIKPKFFIPIHGLYFMRAANVENAVETGVERENCFLVDNGQIVEIATDKIRISDRNVPAYYVMVDGLGVGDVEEVVVRDRVLLAQEGMMVVIVTLDRRTGQFLKNPDIISRGFIYLKENKEMVEELRKKIKGLIGKIPRFQSLEADYLKNMIKDQVGQFVYNKTKRRPMVLPVIIEV
ncbi:MAG TPA: ribonuclease J [Candidatus Paceibacterota bacterium]|nr:ribonuclease J [Candidatus Paceibacterota bacterium]